MSQKKRSKPRDIYELTPKEYDTLDYRLKMCNQWVTFQDEEPPSMHTPFELESNVPNAPNATTDKCQKKRSNQSLANKCTAAKQSKRDDNEMTEAFNVCNNQMDGNFDDIFNDFDIDFGNKTIEHDNATRKIIQMNSINGKAKNVSTKMHTTGKRTHQSQIRPKDSNYSIKRTPIGLKDINDNEFNDFHFDIPSMKQQHAQFDCESIQNQNTELNRNDGNGDVNFDFFKKPVSSSKLIKRKRYDDSHIINFTKDFDGVNNTLDNKQSPPHVIYKRVKSSFSYIDATPKQKSQSKWNTDLHNEKINTKSMLRNDNLFKQPDDKRQKTLENIDYTVDEHRGRHKKKHIDHDLVILNQIQTLKPLDRQQNNKIREHNAIQKHTVTQPIVFNIKCNNLTIKTD